MPLLHALVLGLVQGLTEFLPISSSGHLVLVPALLGWTPGGVAFDAVLHLGTLGAVLAYFRRDLGTLAWGWIEGVRRRRPLGTPQARLAWAILVGSVPAALAGLLLEDWFARAFASPRAVGAFLLGTALLLALAEGLASRGTGSVEDVGLGMGLWVGLAQALAILPGISRSGSTLAAGMAAGLRREAAARFSFLLGTPIIAGAGLLKLLDLVRASPQEGWAALAVGLGAAFLSGYAAIWGLLAYLRRRPLWVFALYCAVAGGFAFIWF